MKNQELLNSIILGSSDEILAKIEDNSIDLVLTDPPYFLDKLDNNWNQDEVHSNKNQYTIKSLPAGMKFSREQGVQLYNWYKKISEEIFRVLKPGGFFFSFSSPRLYHRMASAVDDAGFEIRDGFVWLYTQNQMKAMSYNHVIDKMNISDLEKTNLKERLHNWKTPQLKSCFEPIVFGQKPKIGTGVQNILKYEVGLFNVGAKVGINSYPSNVLTIDEIQDDIDAAFLIKKPSKSEKGSYNKHMTVKPIEICEQIIKLSAFSKEAVVLDPFVGSGTTAIAASNLGLNYIGIDINQEYVEISKKRLYENKQKLL